jgi:aminomethyltransferase
VDVGLNRTPLEEEHLALGAKMGEFAGWSMPIEYRGVLAEHRAVRGAVGVFDLTHLGKIDVEGAGAQAWLQEVVTGDVSPLQVLSAEERSDVVVTHRPEVATIAVQGPRSLDVVGSLFPETSKLDYMTCLEASYRDVVLVAARSGYTGERGFELFASEAVAPALWRDLLDRGRSVGLEPCGLGARDILRLEMGYPLHGSDISPDRTPLEAGLSWAVAIDKGPFPGREALIRQRREGIPARLRALRMEGKQIPRAHYPVVAESDRIGETTSGSFSPTLKVGIALAYLWPADRWVPGERVEVDIRGRRGPAEVVKSPFVDRSPKG